VARWDETMGRDKTRSDLTRALPSRSAFACLLSPSTMAKGKRKPAAESPIRNFLPPFSDEQTSYLNSKLDDFIAAKKQALGYRFCQVLHNQDLKERWAVPPAPEDLLALCENDSEKANARMHKLRIAVRHSRCQVARTEADVCRKRFGT
jgi:hypothetical protein